MDRMYEFMEQCLEIEKQVASFLYMISTLEQFYSEDTQKAEKCLACSMQCMLLQLQKELKKVIQEMDCYVVEEKAQR